MNPDPGTSCTAVRHATARPLRPVLRGVSVIQSNYVHISKWQYGSRPLSQIPIPGPKEYGWVRDEATKTLTPRTLPLDVALAPPQVLELLAAADPQTTPDDLGCESASVYNHHCPQKCATYSVTIKLALGTCACRGGPNCRNPYTIDKERASEDDNDDCAEADGDIDLMME